MTSERERLRFSTLLAFFLPLSVTASLVSFSHLIINSTLARSFNPEMAIAGVCHHHESVCDHRTAAAHIATNVFGIIEG